MYLNVFLCHSYLNSEFGTFGIFAMRLCKFVATRSYNMFPICSVKPDVANKLKFKVVSFFVRGDISTPLIQHLRN